MKTDSMEETVMPAPARFCWAFGSELGWIAFATDGNEVINLKSGHSTVDRAIADLEYGRDSVLQVATRNILQWQNLLQMYAAGKSVDIGEIPVRVAAANTFTGAVQRMCREIPRGTVLTYRELAEQAGSPRAARAVGNVMRTNRIPLLIPCHRVVGATGLGGYSARGGLALKQRLLDMENGSKA